MKPKRIVLSFLLILSSLQLVLAQDKIIQRNEEVIQCKIKEIGLDEVKYVLPEISNDLLFAIDKDDIEKIVFENGKEMAFEKSLKNPANYLDNRKNALKIDFLSPLSGNTTISYERSLKPGRSIEGELGIIGLGIDPGDENPGGVFLRFGYKFLKSPDFYLRGLRYAHLLKGSYIKPALTIGLFSRQNYYYDYVNEYGDDYYYYGDNRTETTVTGAIQLVLGKQWVIDNAFLIDLYWGIGYGFSSNYNGPNYYYSHTIMDETFPMSLSAGLKMGFLW
ncbi:MAG: hypothetical protein KJ578_14765 [Bacteroidetes bacterium]|nr:hypothetical protein [Bacteroidota bacterium]MBU1578508.1 hypothetical protein [Bacteroidota bacterium]MBU2559038.1 hypothetical protein [Bacteroidota bacterium]